MLHVWCSILVVLQAHFSACITVTRWPKGSYGLLKPMTGCPKGFHDDGFVFQDTVDTNPSNNHSDILHIDGYAKRDVLRYFCTKGGTSTYDTSVQWPDGQYCIYSSKGSSLSGMQKGSIRMYDEENNNKDTFKMDYDFVSIVKRRVKWSIKWTYDYTEFHFACQTSGNKKIPISLPITKPFYLLPYGSRDCQQVPWMVATSEWIKYHTREKSDDKVKHGTVPHVNLGNKNSDDVTMYYCYYQSCNHTLVNKRGVFQSPGFPDKYPDGQLCSWRIMVPDNHTVRVFFIEFSLNSSNFDDYLRFFIQNNGTYRNETFYGVKQPFNVTATTEVKFLFRSDKESNSYGFRAEYHVFRSTDDYREYTGTTTTQTTPSESTIQSTMQTSSGNCTSDNSVYKKSNSLGRTEIITAMIIPLAFVMIGFLLVLVILYRCRSKQSRRNKSDARESMSLNQPKSATITPINDETREYESPDNLKKEERSTSQADIDHEYPEYHVLEPTSDGGPENDEQMYQDLSGAQQPEYEAPNYSKRTPDPDMHFGTPEYHELEPMDNNVPDVVYNVLEGPDPNDRPSEDQMYQALEEQTMHNPLYQSTTPATMVTQNPLYV